MFNPRRYIEIEYDIIVVVMKRQDWSYMCRDSCPDSFRSYIWKGHPDIRMQTKHARYYWLSCPYTWNRQRFARALWRRKKTPRQMKSTLSNCTCCGANWWHSIWYTWYDEDASYHNIVGWVISFEWQLPYVLPCMVIVARGRSYRCKSSVWATHPHPNRCIYECIYIHIYSYQDIWKHWIVVRSWIIPKKRPKIKNTSRIVPKDEFNRVSGWN